MRDLENLWHVLREVLLLPDRVVDEQKLGKLKTTMKKMLGQGTSSRTGLNSVISTYYRTGAFGTQQISINGAPPQEVGAAISDLVKSSILASGRDVLFDPNETSFLDDVRAYLDYKAKASKSWLNRVKSAQTFIGKLADGGKRLWAVMYAMALTRAAQTKSPVVIIRRCSRGPSGKPYPIYGRGQDLCLHRGWLQPTTTMHALLPGSSLLLTSPQVHQPLVQRPTVGSEMHSPSP